MSPDRRRDEAKPRDGLRAQRRKNEPRSPDGSFSTGIYGRWMRNALHFSRVRREWLAGQIQRLLCEAVDFCNGRLR